MKKVWNITGMPGGHPARTIMLFGQSVRPGRYVKVEDDQLKRAHKTKNDAELGFVHIGDKLPKGYPGMLNIPRVASSPKRVEGHGSRAVAAPTPTPPKKAAPVKEPVKEPVKMAGKPVTLPTKKKKGDEKFGGK